MFPPCLVLLGCVALPLPLLALDTTQPALPPRTSWSRSSASARSEYTSPAISGYHHPPVTTSTSHPMTASLPSMGSCPPSRMGSLRRTGIPSVSRPSPPPTRHHQLLHDSPDSVGFMPPARASPITTTDTTGVGFRSNSAIDVHAARRAQARAQYANANRLKAGSGVSLREYTSTPIGSHLGTNIAISVKTCQKLHYLYQTR